MSTGKEGMGLEDFDRGRGKEMDSHGLLLGSQGLSHDVRRRRRRGRSRSPGGSDMKERHDTRTTDAPVKRLDPNKARAQALKAQLFDENAFYTERENRSSEVDKRARPTIMLDSRGRPYNLDSMSRQDGDEEDSREQRVSRKDKLGSGSGSRYRDDIEMAEQIISDPRFQDGADYLDENFDRLAKQSTKAGERHRKFVAKDYVKTQKAIERCRFCWHGGRQPAASLISTGLSTYLALPEYSELIHGHCLIVPIEHYSSCLECDDDVWTEIRNFQKSLMRMFADRGLGVIFCETVIDLKKFKHSYIEVFPLPWDLAKTAKAHFREALLSTGEEWSQHRKIIDTTNRGIRRTMVPDLPYFHVWFGLDEGMGHVIEQPEVSLSLNGGSRSRRPGEDDEDLVGFDLDDGNREFDGGFFKKHFAQQIVADMLKLDSQRWRKPRHVDESRKVARMTRFKKMWEPWDWTKEIEIHED